MSIETVLTPRLLAIADFVLPGETIADVGTDHGYIPVYLCEKNIIEKALAMDLRPGPLSRAQKNIERFHLEEKIKTRLSDGLLELTEEDGVDAAVIAGMGGLLIAQILEQAPFGLSHYILQPMTAVMELRIWLSENGYEIVDEKLAQEENKIYSILSVRPGKMTFSDPIYALVGEALLKNRDPLAPKLIEGLLAKYTQTLSGLENAAKVDVAEKMQETKTIVLGLMKLSEVCKTW